MAELGHRGLLVSQVRALTVFDDGGGPALYASGSFAGVGGAIVNSIVKWDGSNWWALGSGMGGKVYGLAAFDDGTGPVLFAGGDFDTAGGVTVFNLGRWDGSSWTPTMGRGLEYYVNAVTVFDDGSGTALYAGGAFTEVGGTPLNYIAKWSGTSWVPLGSGWTTMSMPCSP
jgi:hypothetical protein